MDNSGGNVLKTITHGMSKRKLKKKSISQKSNSWEKAKPTGLERISSRVSDP